MFILGGGFTLVAMVDGRRRHRLDLLHALLQHLRQHQRHPGRIGVFITGFFVHPDRAELHRHHPQDARSGPDLVPPAPVRLGASTPPASSWCWPPPCWRSPWCWWRSNAALHRHLRSRAGRRPAALPAPVLVLLASRRLHHDPARHGRHQRDHRLLLPQADLRLQLRRLFEPGHRRPRLPGLGPPHVRRAASPIYAGWSFPC